MPKDYNNFTIIYHCSFVWSFNNEKVYFRCHAHNIKNQLNSVQLVLNHE